MVVFVKYILSTTIKPWFILLFRVRITIWAIYGDSQWDGRNHLDTVKPLSKWDCLWMQQIVIKCWTGFQEHWCLEPRGKLRTENKTQPTFYLQCFVTANQHQMYLSIVNMKQHQNTYLHKYTEVLGLSSWKGIPPSIKPKMLRALLCQCTSSVGVYDNLYNCIKYSLKEWRHWLSKVDSCIFHNVSNLGTKMFRSNK